MRTCLTLRSHETRRADTLSGYFMTLPSMQTVRTPSIAAEPETFSRARCNVRSKVSLQSNITINRNWYVPWVIPTLEM